MTSQRILGGAMRGEAGTRIVQGFPVKTRGRRHGDEGEVRIVIPTVGWAGGKLASSASNQRGRITTNLSRVL